MFHSWFPAPAGFPARLSRSDLPSLRSLFASVTVLRSRCLRNRLRRKLHCLHSLRLLYSPAHPPADQNHHPAQYILRSHIPSALPVSQFLKSSPLLSVIPSASGSCAAASFCCVSKSTDGNTFRYGRISPMIFENTRWLSTVRLILHVRVSIVASPAPADRKPVQSHRRKADNSSRNAEFFSAVPVFPDESRQPSTAAALPGSLRNCAEQRILDKVAGRLGYCFPDSFRFSSFTTEPCSF